jgi:hypothetical protein
MSQSPFNSKHVTYLLTAIFLFTVSIFAAGCNPPDILIKTALVPETPHAAGDGTNSPTPPPPQLTPTATGGSFTYQVRVQEQGTGESIPNAKVTVDLGNSIASKDEYADGNGLARIFIDAALARKPGRLIVEAPGYKTFTQNIDLDEYLPKIVQLVPLSPSPLGPEVVTAQKAETPGRQNIPTATPQGALTPTAVAVAAAASVAPLPANSTYHGDYFANTEFRGPAVYQRDDVAIAFDWGNSNPGPNVPVDNFSIRWTRCLDFEERYYLFTGRADDNLKVYLDDTKVLDVSQNENSQKYFVAAGRHCLRLDYFEGNGNAFAYFDLK